MNDAVLIRHSNSTGTAITSISVHIARVADVLSLRYQIAGDVSQLVVPARSPSPRRTDELWKHTCVEAFIRPAQSSSYREFNFAPSGDWAAYQFDAYRSGMRAATIEPEPRIDSQATADVLIVAVELHLPAIVTGHDQQQRLALAAIIEERSGGIAYWALAHPAVKPDFHDDAGFALQLPAG